MGRYDKDDPFPPLPTEDELELFAEKRHGGPTLDEFRVLVTGRNARCPWNKRAAALATVAYLEDPLALSTDRDEVESMILTHFRSLSDQYKKIELRKMSPNEEPILRHHEKQARARRETRRRDVCCNTLSHHNILYPDQIGRAHV